MKIGIIDFECKVVKISKQALSYYSPTPNFLSSFLANCAQSIDQTTLELL
jgi:hypothetical protein